MVTVSIFTLRDVIRRMQTEYKTPHNNNTHTSPSTAVDLKDLREHLETQKLQTHYPEREHNKYAIPSRDLMALGAAYANKSSAFKNFRLDTRKAVNKGISQGADAANSPESEDEDNNVYHDLGDDTDIGQDDLAMDEEEFPFGTDPKHFVAMTQEVIDELSKASATCLIDGLTNAVMNSMTKACRWWHPLCQWRHLENFHHHHFLFAELLIYCPLADPHDLHVSLFDAPSPSLVVVLVDDYQYAMILYVLRLNSRLQLQYVEHATVWKSHRNSSNRLPVAWHVAL